MSLIDCGDGVRLERGVRCVLPDGVALLSDHYYPGENRPAETDSKGNHAGKSWNGNGPWPTLLMRQPYGRDIASTVVYAHPVWFARRGYHVVIQDVRGRGDSEGDFYAFRNEGKDGADTIAWLMKHPACNGLIGMYGFSYQGSTQLLAAVENPDGLRCIAPHMTAADLYHGWFYHQGALRLLSTLGWGIQMLREDARRRGLRTASEKLESAWLNVRTQALSAPYGEHSAIVDADLPSYLSDWITHREADGDGQRFWSDLDISTRADKIAVPALHISGWYDTYLEGSIAGYLLLRSHAATEFARRHQYLLAGPWVHIPWGDRVGDLDLSGDANLDTDELLLRWFNHWLKGSGEFDNEPAIRHFALGSNRWYSAENWPEESTAALYLHSDGNANSRRGDGVLNGFIAIAEEPRDVFVYDPEVPVTAPGGGQSLGGSFDQSTIEMGNNLLVYTTAPLEKARHIFGRPILTLFAATSAKSADFTAKLMRVTLSGRVDFISIGIARSGWLFSEGEYLADAVQCWQFALEPTSLELVRGESLRLEIASSAFPLYDRNPSTYIPAASAGPWDWKRSTQQVLHSARYPSALNLPMLDGGAW